MPSDLPAIVSSSPLWKRLDENPELQAALTAIRRNSEVVAAATARILPSFTDHSVAHMDGLWRVCESVVTPEEFLEVTGSEAFLLGASFYLHDLGLALGATEEGVKILRSHDAYLTTKGRLERASALSGPAIDQVALCAAGRAIHPDVCRRLATEMIPGTKYFVIEDQRLRELVAPLIGSISESHGWSLERVEREFGMADQVPLPGGEADIAWVASMLRVCDAAHISFQRADRLERFLRGPIAEDSLMHWRAQEYVAGPARDKDKLKYYSVRSISDVDAWWLFRDLVLVLDREIQGVASLLNSRPRSRDRFSLSGVAHAQDLSSFSSVIRAGGFEPVDIRLRADSMERLVDLLGGEQLYGPDASIAVRELLQNSADAIRLRLASEEAAGVVGAPPKVTIALTPDAESPTLAVIDNGVGMDDLVLTKYLISIASDYFGSGDFYSAYNNVATKFDPIGRFGIGFLSVFMISNEVEVETEKAGGRRLKLNLRGVGARGYLQELPRTGRQGTSVTLKLKREVVPKLKGLQEIVLRHAPMIGIPIELNEDGEELVVNGVWWSAAPQETFLSRLNASSGEVSEKRGRAMSIRNMRLFYSIRQMGESSWPSVLGAERPEVVWQDGRIVASIGGIGTRVCCKGFAVSAIPTPGFVGLVEHRAGSVRVDRSGFVDWDPSDFVRDCHDRLRPLIINWLSKIEGQVHLPSIFSVLRSLGASYGSEVLNECSLRWIPTETRSGEMRMLSPGALSQEVERCAELCITLEVPRWKSWRLCRDRHFGASRDVLIIALPGQSDVLSRYEEKDEVTTAPLRKHINPSRNQVGVPVLLDAVLKLVSDAWGVRLDVLTSAQWARSLKHGELSVHLRKP